MNIVSPKLDRYLSSSVPTLSISDAERGVYHDCSLSETATTAVSTTRLRTPSGHLDDNPIGFHTPTRSHQGATLRPLCIL